MTSVLQFCTTGTHHRCQDYKLKHRGLQHEACQDYKLKHRGLQLEPCQDYKLRAEKASRIRTLKLGSKRIRGFQVQQFFCDAREFGPPEQYICKVALPHNLANCSLLH